MSGRQWQNQRDGEERVQAKHGEEVDVNGTACLFLDDGTRKGLWLSANKAGCVMKNLEAIRAFNAKHAKPVVTQTALEADNARMKAESIEKQNLGYFAGYYDNETRERVERLFGCSHPVFGSIKEKGAPTSESAFAAGISMGDKVRQ